MSLYTTGTVKALQPEKSIFDAYTQLRTSVYNRTLQLNPLHDKVWVYKLLFICLILSKQLCIFTGLQ